MPIYLYWGEDDFALGRAVEALRDRTLDPQWASFNYDKIPPDELESVIQGLNQALTPPFGSGGRFVWLVDTPLFQSCSEDLYAELERSLSVLGDVVALDREELDLCNLHEVQRILRELRPDLIVNASAYTARTIVRAD